MADSNRDERKLGREEFARELHALLFPEQYPPGDRYHDPDHPFWQGEPEEGEVFEWSAETIEWVVERVKRELGMR